jgi:hypothetical protein
MDHLIGFIGQNLFMHLTKTLQLYKNVCCRLQDLSFSETQQLKLDYKHLQVI